MDSTDSGDTGSFRNSSVLLPLHLDVFVFISSSEIRARRQDDANAQEKSVFVCVHPRSSASYFR